MHPLRYILTKRLVRWMLLLLVLSNSLLGLAQEFTQQANLVIVSQRLPKGPFAVGKTFGLQMLVRNEGRTTWSGQFIVKAGDGSIEQHLTVAGLKPKGEIAFSPSGLSPTHTGAHTLNFYYQTDGRGRGRLLDTAAGLANYFSFTVSGGSTAAPDVRLDGDLLFYKDGQGGGTSDLYVGESYQLAFLLRNHGAATFNGTVYTTKRGETTHFLDPVPNDFTIAPGKLANVKTRAVSPTNVGAHTVDVWVKPNGKTAQRVGSLTFNVKRKAVAPSKLELSQTIVPEFFPSAGGSGTTRLTVGTNYYLRFQVRNTGQVSFKGRIFTKKRDAQGKRTDFVAGDAGTYSISAGGSVSVKTKTYTPTLNASYTIEIYAQPEGGGEILLGSLPITTQESLSDVRLDGDLLFYKDGQGGGTSDLYVGESYQLAFLLRNHGAATFNGTVYTTKRGETTHFLDPVPNDFTIAPGKLANVKTRAVSPTNVGAHTVDVWVKPNGGAAQRVGSLTFNVKQKAVAPSKLELSQTIVPEFFPSAGGSGTTRLTVGTNYYLRFQVRNTGQVSFKGRIFTKKRDAQGKRTDFVAGDAGTYSISAGGSVSVKTKTYTPTLNASYTIEIYAQPEGGSETLLGSLQITTATTAADVRLDGDLLFYKDGQGGGTTDLYVSESYQLAFLLRNHGAATFNGTVYTTKRGETTHFLDPVPNDFTIAPGKLANVKTRAISPTNVGAHTVDVWVKPNGGAAQRVGSLTFNVKQKAAPATSSLSCSSAPQIQGATNNRLVVGKSYTFVCTVSNTGTALFNNVLYLCRANGSVVGQTAMLRISAGRSLQAAVAFTPTKDDVPTATYTLYSKNNQNYEVVAHSQLKAAVQQQVEPMPDRAIRILTLQPDINQLVPREVYPEQTLHYHFRITDSNNRPKAGVSLQATWEKVGGTLLSSTSDAEGLLSFAIPVSAHLKANQADRILFVNAKLADGQQPTIERNEFAAQPTVTRLNLHTYDPKQVEVVLGYDEETLKNLQGGKSLADAVKFKASCIWERDEQTHVLDLTPDHFGMSAGVEVSAEVGADVGKIASSITGMDALSNRFTKNLMKVKATASAKAKAGFQVTADAIPSAASTIAGYSLLGVKEWVTDWLNPSNKWVKRGANLLDAGISYFARRMTPIKSDVELALAFDGQLKGGAHIPKMPRWFPLSQQLGGYEASGELSVEGAWSEKLKQDAKGAQLHESVQGKFRGEGELLIPAFQVDESGKFALEYKGTTKFNFNSWNDIPEVGASAKVRKQLPFRPYRMHYPGNGIDLKGIFVVKGGLNVEAELIGERTINYGGIAYNNMIFAAGQSPAKGRPTKLETNLATVRDYMLGQRYVQSTLDELKAAIHQEEAYKVELTGGLEPEEISLFGFDIFRQMYGEAIASKGRLPLSVKYSYPAHKNQYYHAQAKRFLTTDSYQPTTDLAQRAATSSAQYITGLFSTLSGHFKRALNVAETWCKEVGLWWEGVSEQATVVYTNSQRYISDALHRAPQLRLRARTMAAQNIEPQISHIKFTIEGNDKVFVMGTAYDFSYAYPAGEASGKVAATGEEFVVVSDIFYLNAESPEGQALRAAPNGSFTVECSVGRDDLAILSLAPRSRVMLYHLPQGATNAQWEVVGEARQRHQCRGLGCYALGVSLQQDKTPPAITCRTDLEQQCLYVQVEDNVGVNWNSLSIAVNGRIRAYRRSGETGTVVVPLLPNDLATPDEMTLLVTATDLAHNTARFEQLPEPTGLAAPSASDEPRCSAHRGQLTLHTDESWQGATYAIYDMGGHLLAQGRVEQTTTHLLPLYAQGTCLLRLTQQQRTFTTTFINTPQ